MSSEITQLIAELRHSAGKFESLGLDADIVYVAARALELLAAEPTHETVKTCACIWFGNGIRDILSTHQLNHMLAGHKAAHAARLAEVENALRK